MRHELMHRPFCVLNRVNGFNACGTVLRVFFIPIGGVLFLNLAGISKHQSGEIASRIRANDFAAIALLHQRRQRAAVVNMRVRKQDMRHTLRIERQFRITSIRLGAMPLVHPTVQQNSMIGGFDEVAGAGYFAGRAVECGSWHVKRDYSITLNPYSRLIIDSLCAECPFRIQ